MATVPSATGSYKEVTQPLLKEIEQLKMTTQGHKKRAKDVEQRYDSVL
jgi:hypothetical protein